MCNITQKVNAYKTWRMKNRSLSTSSTQTILEYHSGEYNAELSVNEP